MDMLLVGNSIPETVKEFVIGMDFGCCFDEIKKSTFDKLTRSLILSVLNILVASFKFNFSAKPLHMSFESDLLSRNTLVVTVLEPFQMITGIVCKKVHVLSERVFIVVGLNVLWVFEDVLWINVKCSCPQLSILQRKCELQF